MTNLESEQELENGSVASDELLELKKELADEVVDKLLEKDPGLTTFILKWSMSDYLVKDGSLWDFFRDEILIWKLWESAWVITPALKRYREMFSKVSTKSELESLKTTIFNEISWASQTSGEQSWESGEKSGQSSQSGDSREVVASSGKADSWLSGKARESSGKSYEIDHFNIDVSSEAKTIWNSLKGKEKPDLEPFACAYKVYKREKSLWHLKNTEFMSVVDFTKNQETDNRLFVINMNTKVVEYAEKCGHGEWSGGREWTTSFWNTSWSHKSSLWAFVTPDESRFNTKGTWRWSFPRWLESSNNSVRWIAIHPVKSLTYQSWRPTSKWCFTLPISQSEVDEILNKINWWSLVFSYAKSKDYFAQSDYFQQSSDGRVAA